jgi:hypothetical protein
MCRRNKGEIMNKSLFHRPTCLLCVSKHLASAQILLDESLLGYTEHRWLAVGHLNEAESESLEDYPLFSQKIRCLRIILMGQECEVNENTPSIMDLLREARLLAEKGNGYSEKDHLAMVIQKKV